MWKTLGAWALKIVFPLILGWLKDLFSAIGDKVADIIKRRKLDKEIDEKNKHVDPIVLPPPKEEDERKEREDKVDDSAKDILG